MPDGLAGQVDVHPAGEGKGDDEGRRSQVVRGHQRMDAGLKVPVAREHSGEDGARGDVPTSHRLHRLWLQLAAVANAGHAPVSCHVEPELVEVFLKTGLLKIVSDNARARGEGRLDMRGDAEPHFDRLLGQQPCTDHHAGVGGIGAAGDRGDDDVPVCEPFSPFFLGLLAPPRTPAEALEIGLLGVHAGLEVALELCEGDPIVRALRARHARLNRTQINLDHPRVLNIVGVRVREEEILPAVLSSKGDFVAPPSRLLIIGESHLVWREVSHCGAILGRHVRNRRTVGEAEALDPFPEEFDELPHHSFLPKHLDNLKNEVGGHHPFGQCPFEPHPKHFGERHDDRLAEDHGERLDPADPPADNAEAVDHRAVRVGPDHRIGKYQVRGAGVLEDAARQVLQVHLVDDPRPWGNHGHVLKGPRGPLEQREPLVVPGELLLHVNLQRVWVPGRVGDHRVVDHEVDGDQRVHGEGILPELVHPGSHRRQVHQAGPAGHVLHDHPARLERYLGLGGRLAPVQDRVDIRLEDRLAVTVADG
mmetsp:Transcript_3680/g.8740  ORF Transcript_3680/g.8740 Transcript_3680/m.8740 type:complete len:534 (-) Transcript_3680:317-1918(-)